MSSLKLDYSALEACYTRQLKDIILPFWQKNSYDSLYGGFFTCFSNDSSRLLSTDKYIWSQGRMIWILSRLSQLDLFSSEEKQLFLLQARHTLDFVLDHCLLDDKKTCAFLLTREGIPKEQEEGLGLAPSTFADCFMALALTSYIGAANDCSFLSVLKQLFESILQRYQTNRFCTSPFYIPDNTRYHAIPMIMLNLCNEYGDLMQSLSKNSEAERLYALAAQFRNTILDTFVSDDGALIEMVNTVGLAGDRFLFNYVNPGHAMEDCWFMLISAVRDNCPEVINKILSVVDRSFELGWDPVYGGIRYYVHKNGGTLCGTYENEPEQKAAGQMLKDCDNKLWWPNTEGMYATLLSYSLSGQEKYLDMYIRLHAYTLSTFPNPDPSVGEWIQLRDRQGKPFSKEVGGRLPVKDPYHIMRDLILLIQLVRRLKSHTDP